MAMTKEKLERQNEELWKEVKQLRHQLYEMKEADNKRISADVCTTEEERNALYRENGVLVDLCMALITQKDPRVEKFNAEMEAYKNGCHYRGIR